MTDHALRRHSFDQRADEYRTARPNYPAEVYDLLAAQCGLGPGCRVLEVGAGTGSATRQLLARGAQVLAVEPGARLATHLHAELGQQRLQIVVSDIETAQLPPRSFDLVACATAFHWIRAETAMPLLAEAVVDGGWLAVWWTSYVDPERSTPFREQLAHLYQRHMPGETVAPGSMPGPMQVRDRVAELEQGGWFEVTDTRMIRWEHQLTAAGARGLFGSFSGVNELADSERRDFLDAVGTLIDARFGGMVRDPYVTSLYIARRRDSSPRS